MTQKVFLFLVLTNFMFLHPKQTHATNCNDLHSVTSELASLKLQLWKMKQTMITACRVCFQETEGSSQCQGTRSSCSGWSTSSSWTAPFRDDTDNRAGGCLYQWKLECLNEHERFPIVLKEIEINKPYESKI